MSNINMNISAAQAAILGHLETGGSLTYNSSASPRFEGFPVGRGAAMSQLVNRGFVRLLKERKDGTRQVRITKAGIAALEATQGASV